MVDMRDKSRHKHQVDWAVPNDLTSDMDVTALGVSGFGKHRYPRAPYQTVDSCYRMAWTRIERSKPLNETSPRSWKARPFPMQSSQTTFDTRLCSGCAWEQSRAAS